MKVPLTPTLSPQAGRGRERVPSPRESGERVRVRGEAALVHSSDVHIDDSRGTAGLGAVLATVRALQAEVTLLAGDTFENNQLSAAILDRAGLLE